MDYRKTAHDDARQVEGLWYYRDLLTCEYRVFASQRDMVLLFKNPPTDTGYGIVSSSAPQPQSAYCVEKERLVDAYGTAVNEYSRTVLTLRTRRGVLPKPEYEQMRVFSEEARLRCEAAHRALEQHIRDHGC